MAGALPSVAGLFQFRRPWPSRRGCGPRRDHIRREFTTYAGERGRHLCVRGGI